MTLKSKSLAEKEAAELEAAQSQQKDSGEGGGMMLRMGMEETSNHLWVSIRGPEAGLTNLEIAAHIPSGFTNAIEIFTCTNLLDFWWTLAETNVLTEGTDTVYWTYQTTEAETGPVFVTIGNAVIDSDQDGVNDAREKFLYHTDAELADTDGDSYSDGEELQWGTDPLDIQSMPRLGRGVVINEVLSDPAGADAGNEWVEFFNTNRVPVELTDFTVQVGSTAFGNVFTFPTNTILNSGEFLLVGGSSVPNADHVVELNMVNRGSSGPTAGIRLVAPNGVGNLVVDTLLYAPNNSYNLPATAFGTDGFAPYANSGESLARIRIGYDTDHASDWMYTASLTPTGQGELPDIDGDGIINSVEIAGYTSTYGVVHTDYNNADTDFDTFSDLEELTNQPPTDAALYDTDGDAFPWGTNGVLRGNDGDEVHNMGTDPTDPDSDSDGLPDGWEAAMGLNPNAADSDNNTVNDGNEDSDSDGTANVAEMNQNSNPASAASTQPQDYRLVLYHLPKAGWGNGDDMGTLTWAGYRFDNVINTTSVAFVLADGGYSEEAFSVTWKNATGTGETGGRTNLVWATLLPGTVPELIVTDGGTTWPNENPNERGADLSVTVLKVELEKCSSSFEPNGGDADNTTTIRAFVTPSGVQGKFRFTLTGVSSEPGYCLNMPKPAPGSGEDSDAWKDLQFPDQSGFTISGTDRDVAETTATDLNEATVTIKSYDYGAYGQIKAEFIPNGTGPSCTATEQGGSKEYTNIPRDDDENHIWDGWSYSSGSAAQDADVNTGGSLWGDAGDGLTRYEEYRGLVRFGTLYTRLNPTYKDVFVDNRDYVPFADDFAAAAAVQVRYVGDDYDAERIINFNHETAHDIDQHVLVLVRRNLGTEWGWGLSYPGFGRSPQDVDETRVDENRIRDECYSRDDEFVRLTVLHELCHGIGAEHHIPPSGTPGYSDCIMRDVIPDCQAAGSDSNAWSAITVGTTWLYKQETQQVSDNY